MYIRNVMDFLFSKLICVDLQATKAKSVVSWKSFIFFLLSTFLRKRQRNDKEKQMWPEQIRKFFCLHPLPDYVSNHCQMCVKNFLHLHHQNFLVLTFGEV